MISALVFCFASKPAACHINTNKARDESRGRVSDYLLLQRVVRPRRAVGSQNAGAAKTSPEAERDLAALIAFCGEAPEKLSKAG